MAQRTTPAQLAEAPPTTGSHPAVRLRLVEQMDDLANLVAATGEETFVDDEAWKALQRLRAKLEAAAEQAETRRRVHLAQQAQRR